VISLKLFFISFLFFVLLSGFVSSQAVNVDFVKDSFFSGETVQAEVFVDGLEFNLESNMLNLFQNDSSVSINPHLIKINSSYYYLYFDLDEEFSGNHNLIFEDVIFSENGSTYQSDFSFSFDVQETNSSIFSISPGFVKADDLQFNNLFYVYLFNNRDEEIDVVLNSEYSFIDLSSTLVHLNGGSSGFFTIYLSELLVSNESDIKFVDIFSGSFGYNLPVWFGNTEDVVEVSGDGVYFVEGSEFFDVTVEKGETLSGGYVRFENGFDYAVDLEFSLTGNLDDVIELEFESLENVEPSEIVSLGIEVFGSEAGSYEGYVILNGSNFEDNFLIKVTVLDVVREIVLNDTVGDNVSGGDVVDDSEVPEDEEEKSEFKFGTWFWVALFVLAIGLFMFIRYKKKKVKKSHPFFQK
jgi:hypothetical protein